MGKREPRERVLWGEMGGRETLTVPAPGEGLGRPDSPAVPPTLAQAWVTWMISWSLVTICLGGWTKPESQGSGSGRKAPPSPGRTASSLCLKGRAAPGTPPGAPERRPAGAE